MQYGDLSNRPAPALVINADLLGEITKSRVLRRKDFKPFSHSRDLMTAWYMGGISIYVVCLETYIPYHELIEKRLDDFFIPYTRIIDIESAYELDYLVKAQHIVGYYYNSLTLVNERTDKSKHNQVLNVAEVSYLLNGGER